MRISLIGAGRVASHLAKILVQQHELVQIYSRGFEKASLLAAETQCQAIAHLKQLDTSVDLIIMAVSDQSIAILIEELHVYAPDTLIVHTSGSTDLKVLTAVHEAAGVLYPLQTFSLTRDIDWQHTPIFVEASNQRHQELLVKLAQGITSRIYTYSSAQRLSLHLAAVFACNFSNYCYDMAKQILDAQQVDFNLLSPLICETADKACANEPMQMQTGPAMRADHVILDMHQNMLMQAQREDLAAVYNLLSQQILVRHHP